MLQHFLQRIFFIIFGCIGCTAIQAQRTDTTVVFQGMRYDQSNPANNILVNPERGFRAELMFDVSNIRAPMWGAVNIDKLPSSAATTKAYAGSVIQTYFYLFKYWNTNIPDSAIATMKGILDLYRKNGIKALVRFCYDWGEPNEYPKNFFAYTVQDIQRHIGQLKGFMEAYKDVIYAFQLGWVGAWGEWHSNKHYNFQDYPDATAAICQAFLNGIPKSHKVTFRLPEYKNNSSLSFFDKWNRAGFNNDFFTLDTWPSAYETGDYTYNVPWHIAVLNGGNSVNPDFFQVRDEARSTIMDGEMPYNGPKSDQFNTIISGFNTCARMYAHSYSTFSWTHNTNNNIAAWKTQMVTRQAVINEGLPRFDLDYFTAKNGSTVNRSAYELIRDHLGYRLQIEKAVYPVRAEQESILPVSLDLRNVGMAAPVKVRYGYFVLIDEGAGTIVSRSNAIDFQITTMYNASSSPGWNYYKKNLNGFISTAGLQQDKTYKLGLWLPDASASIRDSASYSIRTANEGVSWFAPDGRYGVNVFGEVKITPPVMQQQVAPGGVLTPVAGLVNGLRYELYSGWSEMGVSAENLYNGIYGTLQQTGYTGSAWGFDKGISNQLADNGVLVFKGKVNILSAGSYDFTMQGIDDYGMILVNGDTAYMGAYGVAGKYKVVGIATPGLYDIEIRFANTGGTMGTNSRCEPLWRAIAGGPDVGSAFVRIPDSRFYTPARLGTWHKADAGVSGNAGAAATVWGDQASNDFRTNLVPRGTAPVYNSASGLMNFNPVLRFNNNGAMISGYNANNLAYGTQGNTQIAVAAAASTTQTAYISAFGQDNSSSGGMAFVHSNSGKLRTGTVNGSTVTSASSSFITAGTPLIGIQQYESSQLTAADNNAQYVNGVRTGQARDNTSYKALNDREDFSIGVQNDGSNYWTGGIAEVINYPWTLSEGELRRVNSYLAIKYGITLDGGNYVFSDSLTEMWTRSANAGYINDIAGIGRDDASGLLQKQSQSTNANGFVTIGVGSIAATNSANTDAIGDKSSLVWAASTAAAPVLKDDSRYTIAKQGVNALLDKYWKVQRSGSGLSGKTIRVAVAAAGGVLPVTGSFLIISTTGNFDGNAESYYPLTNDNTYLYTDVPEAVLANAAYFTFGSKIIAPGGVVPGLSVWLSADSNYVSGATDIWTARNRSGYQLQQATASAKPLLQASSINFNPVLAFDGVNDELKSAAGNIPITAITATSGSSPSAQFSVFNPAIVGGSVFMYSANSASKYVAGLTSYSNLQFNFFIQQANLGSATSPLTGAAGQTTLAGLSGTKTAASWSPIGINGNALATATTNSGALYETANQLLHAGSAGGGSYFKGRIGEIIYYKNTVTYPDQWQRINSYLAIKYGITLGNTLNPVSYVNTAATVIWPVDGVYQNNVAGIGRDDNEGLLQKQSRSENATVKRQLTIGLGNIASSNATNVHNFDEDRSYLVWGDNGQTATLGADINAGTAPVFLYNTSSINNHMQRVWKVNASAFAQPVKLNVSATDVIGTVGLNGACAKLCLVTATDAAFTTAVKTTILTLEDTSYTCTTTFPEGASYFSFARVQIKPEGTVALPTTTTTPARLYSTCLQDGWQYFYADGTAAGSMPGPALNDGTKKIFAIHANGNILPANLEGMISYQAAPWSASSGSSQVNIMGRLLTINPAGGNYTVNGGVKVRVYYSRQEQVSSLVAASTSQRWFKYTGDAAATVAANTGNNIPGAIFYPDIATGTEEGVDYVEYTGIQSFSTFGHASSNGLFALPVKLSNFIPVAGNCTILLQWQSEKEENFNRYEVERSTDGVVYTKLHTLPGRNTPNAALYDYADNAVTDGIRYSYRLKMVDIDGKVEYSRVVTVKASCGPAHKVEIFPNPIVAGAYKITLTGYTRGALLRMSDQQGRIVDERRLANGLTEINAASLAPGVYMIRVVDLATKKIVIQKLVIAAK